MSIKALAAAAMLLAIGAPAFAQSAAMHSDQSGAMHSPQGERGRPGEEVENTQEHRGPTTRQLNRRVSNYTTMRTHARSEYRRDRRAYMAAVMRRHRQSVSRYHRRYARQEMAYANAMSAWRHQVSACHRGNRRACNAHTPRVADFY